MGGFVYVLGSLGSLQETLLWDWEFLPPLQAPQIFTARGFEALVSHAGTLGCTFCLPPRFSFWLISMWMWIHLVQQPPPSPHSPLPCHMPSLPLLLISTPPTSLDECFFYNSLVVRLPYSSIFWQLWLFFSFLNLLLSFFGCVRKQSISTYASIWPKS